MLRVTDGAGLIDRRFLPDWVTSSNGAPVTREVLTCAGNLVDLCTLAGHPRHLTGACRPLRPRADRPPAVEWDAASSGVKNFDDAPVSPERRGVVIVAAAFHSP